MAFEIFQYPEADEDILEAINYYKKISNRKVRRYKGDIINGNWYQKIFDYWWTMS